MTYYFHGGWHWFMQSLSWVRKDAWPRNASCSLAQRKGMYNSMIKGHGGVDCFIYLALPLGRAVYFGQLIGCGYPGSGLLPGTILFPLMMQMRFCGMTQHAGPLLWPILWSQSRKIDGNLINKYNDSRLYSSSFNREYCVIAWVLEIVMPYSAFFWDWMTGVKFR